MRRNISCGIICTEIGLWLNVSVRPGKKRGKGMKKVFRSIADFYTGLDVAFHWACFIGTIILFFVWLVGVVQRLVEWLRDKFRKDDE